MQLVTYLASIVDNYGDNIGKRFIEAGIPVAVLGILTVFAVLTLIWGALELLKYFFYTIPEQKKKDQTKTAPKNEPAPVAPVVSAPVAASNDEEIVAAIIAAITAARADEGISPTVGFRVVSFKKRK